MDEGQEGGQEGRFQDGSGVRDGQGEKKRWDKFGVRAP